MNDPISDDFRSSQEVAAIHAHPMAWALRRTSTPEHVHIASLGPEENGLKCNCMCIGCGEPVVAVNSNKPSSHFDAPSAKQKHFKHHKSHLDNGQCSRNVARKVALRLFVEQGLVELPPSLVRKSITLPSGEVVHLHREGEPKTLRVVQRVWINDLNVSLIGDDGFECLVTVHSSYSIDDHGSSTCVISLHNVLDQSLANLSSDQILKLLNDPVRGPLWLRHRDDRQLSSMIAEDVKHQESSFFGDIPSDLLEGLTGKQRGETILHWLIKCAVSNAGQLNVPEHSVPVTMTMPNGVTETRNAVCPAGVLVLQDVRFEKRLDSMVPDVICKARMLNTNFPAVEMLIEAAVTHYIDAEKRQKIATSGLACLEIRAANFQQVGRVNVSHIEDIVRADESIKAWIAHPWMERYIEGTKLFLHRRANLISAHIEEREQAAMNLNRDHTKYSDWLSTATDSQLAKGYIKALRAQWRDLPQPMMGSVKVSTEDLWNALTARGLVKASSRSIEAKGGLLHQLLRVNEAQSEDELDILVDEFSQSVMSTLMDGDNAVLLMFSLDAKMTTMSVECRQRYEDQRKILVAQIDLGNEHRSRSSRFESFFSLLFPALREPLASQFATAAYLSNIREAKAKARANQERKARVRETRLAIVREGRARQVENERRSTLNQAFADLDDRFRWRVSIHEFPSLASLFDRYRAKFSDTDALTVFKAARESVSCGENVESTIRRFGFTNASDLKAALDLLQKANLCVERST